ncbi:hypothetical protein [Arcticibacter tournemirensis]|uniref:Sulfatase N-terminal domain-containing protein n=1 Tax=Arcticibacter tournemirensis TaxID=699437 RepID=A0A4Q0M5B4_9SPHI|nr:hypothetical protein [Arcticibacter tournemirensis]RXF67983.1 hypothetical protein EKH83_17065 [Arcticibacter tournemirensis]
MKGILSTVNKLLLFLFLLVQADLLKAQSQKPNIVLIFIDDMGWKDAGLPAAIFIKLPTSINWRNKGWFLPMPTPLRVIAPRAGLA